MSYVRRSRLLLLLAIIYTFAGLCVFYALQRDVFQYRPVPLSCPAEPHLLLNIPAFLALNQSRTFSSPSLSCLSNSDIPLLSTYAHLAKRIPPNIPPYLPYIHAALSVPQVHLSHQQSLVSDPDTLTILYSHQYPNDAAYTTHVISVLRTINPKSVFLIVQQGHESCLGHLQVSLQKHSVTTTVLSLSQHEMLHTIYDAHNVFVHRGPEAVLAALCVRHNLYYTADGLSPYIEQNQYKWLLTASAYQVPFPQIRKARRILNAMGVVTPSACDFQPFGIGDEEKIICANAHAFSTSNCWILSVGCGGRWTFEEDIVNKTTCNVHTFDCTGDWSVPTHLENRVHLHKLCLGAKDDPEHNFMSWESLIRIGGQGRMPSLTKMDIEGHEYPVMSTLLNGENDAMWPQQIAMELHVRSRFKVDAPMVWDEAASHSAVSEEILSSFFRNLSSKGYRLVHRADNPYCVACSEITLVRYEGLPDV